MNDFFTFFAEIGNYIIFVFLFIGLFSLAYFCKKILNRLSESNSNTGKKVICVILCIVAGVVGLFSVICSMAMPKSSDNIFIIYYDKNVPAGDTMHIVFKGKPDTAYDIEFDGGACPSTVERTNGAGYYSYTYKTSISADKGEESFYIYDLKNDISSEYYYYNIK